MFGGVPRVCRGPEMHCTATNGGIRTSTLDPGAAAANARAVTRTASPTTERPGSGAVPSRSHSATASTAPRTATGSGGRRLATSTASHPKSLDRQRGDRTGLIDRQVRQYRRQQAA